jgi:FtsH-binding integral membrane protein
MDYWEQSGGKQSYQIAGAGTAPASLTQFMTQVYTWMALGLSITGFVAVAVTRSQTMLALIWDNPPVLIFLILLELGLVIGFSVAVRKTVSPTTLFTMFLVYSAVNGLTLSAIFLVYTAASIASTFFVTAGSFAGLACYGYVTKRDLSAAARVAFMVLIGLILASLVNFFVSSSGLSFGISLAGVGVFAVLTAADTQRLKLIHQTCAHDQHQLKRFGLMGALQLYLDFINLFLHLLRLMGNRR